MSDDTKSAPPPAPPIAAYKIKRKGGHLEVLVTSGTMAGKTARLIPTHPSAAYFNDRSDKDKKAG